MNTLIDSVINILEGETDLYTSLLAVLEKEKDAVIGVNLDAMNRTSKEKENILLQIRILEEQRSRIIEKMADKCACLPQDLTLSYISSLAEERHSVLIDEHRKKLRALARDIESMNRQNKRLINHSLSLVNGSLSMLERLVQSSEVYYRSGHVHPHDCTGKVVSGTI